MAAGDSFLGLRNFIKGKITPRQLIDVDPLITDVKVDKNNLAQSKIEISFDSTKDLLESLGFSSDDSWFYGRINSYHGPYEFHTWDSIDDDFKQGYSTHFFSDENKELMKKISNLFSNETLDFDEEESIINFFKLFSEVFEEQYRNIVNDLSYERNSAMNQSAQDAVNSDIDRWMSSHDYKLNGDEDGIWVTIADLISNFMRYNIPHEDIKSLLETISANDEPSFNWSEDYWGYENESYFDSDNFNNNVERELGKVIDELENSDAKYPAPMSDFLDLVRRINKKFPVNVIFQLPKMKEVKFSVKGFDREKNKINLVIYRNNQAKTLSLSEENFYHLLYQPTLFYLDELN